jgi:hypothetical protein
VSESPVPQARWKGPWVWPIIIAALALVGVLLALADIALNSPWLGPLSEAVVALSSLPHTTIAPVGPI